MRRENEQLKKECQNLGVLARNDGRQPPEGDIAVLCTDIESSTRLWEHDNNAMGRAIGIHDSIMRQCITENLGYEVATEGDAFQVRYERAYRLFLFVCCHAYFLKVVFQCATRAVRCALSAQLRLLNAEWPPSLLAHPSAETVRSEIGQVIFSGLRVRMGLHYGEPVFVTKPSASNQRSVYHGPVIDIAKRVSLACYGGQIIATDEIWRQFCNNLAALGSPEVRNTRNSKRIGTNSTHCNKILDLGRHCLVENSANTGQRLTCGLRQVTPVALAEAQCRRFLSPRYLCFGFHPLQLA